MNDEEVQNFVDERQSIHNLQLVMKEMGKQLEEHKKEIDSLNKLFHQVIYPMMHEMVSDTTEETHGYY